jgi:hypothetical protein
MAQAPGRCCYTAWGRLRTSTGCADTTILLDVGQASQAVRKSVDKGSDCGKPRLIVSLVGPVVWYVQATFELSTVAQFFREADRLSRRRAV